MQYFYINHGATLPSLRMELVNDGKYDFFKNAYFNNAIQNADITFSMWDEHDVLRVANASCNIILEKNESCEDRYIIEYKWKERDTRHTGQFRGRFTIKFNDDIYQEDVTYESGTLIVPIFEDLIIYIK